MKYSPFLSMSNVGDNVIAVFHAITMDLLFVRDNVVGTADIDSLLSRLVPADESIRHQFLVHDDFDAGVYLESQFNDCCRDVFSFTTLKLFTTTKCNLRCRYCLIEENLSLRHVATKHLSTTTALRALEFFCQATESGDSRPRTLMLYGGEPLLNWDVIVATVEAARAAERNGRLNGPLEIVLETNGTLVTTDIATFLARHRVSAIVSLDGTRDIHDHYRKDNSGTGTWNKAALGYRTLRENGCMAVISSVFTDQFAKNSRNAVKNLVTEFGPPSIGLNLYHVLDGTAMVGDECLNRLDAYIAAWEEARVHGVYVEHIMRRIRPLVQKRLRTQDCGACGHRLVCDADGKIGICEGFVGKPDYFIERQQPSELLCDPVFKDWANRTQLRMPQCIGCKAQGICGGGCVYNGIVIGGGIWQPDPYICRSSQSIVDWAVQTWYRETDVKERLKNEPFTWLLESERAAILGSVPLHPSIPLQDISKEREIVSFSSILS